MCFANGYVFSASTDKSLKVWSVETFQLHNSVEVRPTNTFFVSFMFVPLIKEAAVDKAQILLVTFLLALNILMLPNNEILCSFYRLSFFLSV